MLVTFIIGADDRQCHQNPSFMMDCGALQCDRGAPHLEELLAVSTKKKDNQTVSTVGSHRACVEIFCGPPQYFVTIFMAALCSLQF